MLLKANANPNAQDRNTWTPALSLAVEKHMPDVIELLVKADANIPRFLQDHSLVQYIATRYNNERMKIAREGINSKTTNFPKEMFEEIRKYLQKPKK